MDKCSTSWRGYVKLTWTKVNSLQLREPPTDGREVNPSRKYRKKPMMPSTKKESVAQASVLSK
jgi:hypothetical protein